MAGATSTLTTNNNNNSNKTNGNWGGHGVSLSRGDDITTSMDREGGDLFSFDKRELLFGGDMDNDDGEDGDDQHGIISYYTLSYSLIS